MAGMTAFQPAAANVIDYARPSGEVVALDPRCARVARLMVWLAVLSGLCVAVCFAAMAWGTAGAVLHATVFGATIMVAIRAGVTMGAAGWADQPRQVLDAVAGAGLIVLGLTPLFAADLDGSGRGDPSVFAIAAAFGLLAATTARHPRLYRQLSQWAAAAGQERFARRLAVLGYAKAIYEGLWLACCTATLLGVVVGAKDDALIGLAFGAFFGCLGFVPIWIWMIVAHGKLAQVVR